MDRDDILDFLTQYKQKLYQQFHVQKIGLFGSFAREEANNESDIDLIIQTSHKSFRNRQNLKQFLESHLHRHVDIGYRESLHPFVRKQIDKEIIYV